MSVILAIISFVLSPTGRWIAVGGASVVSLFITYQTAHWKGDTQGYNRAIAQIAAQDKEAVDAANTARDRLRACRDSGGVWDQSSGVCAGR